MPNRIKCAKCHDVITSTHRHDFKRCKCGSIFIDGGNDYLRTGGELEDIIIVNDDDIETPLLELNK